jgi:hypothetical protein
MRNQEQTLRAYYASMTDAELARTAENRASFVATAQKLLEEEMARRGLSTADVPVHEPGRHEPHFGAWRIGHFFRHAFRH